MVLDQGKILNFSSMRNGIQAACNFSLASSVIETINQPLKLGV
jgi:hypothetical protein